MNEVVKNNALVELLKSEVSILSSQVLGINIHIKDHALIIEVDIKLLYVKEKCLKLIFSDIQKYAFYNNSNNDIYYIEIYKLIKKDDLFYISFDPEDEDLSSISENDNDLILCGGIEGYLY